MTFVPETDGQYVYNASGDTLVILIVSYNTYKTPSSIQTIPPDSCVIIHHSIDDYSFILTKSRKKVRFVLMDKERARSNNFILE